MGASYNFVFAIPSKDRAYGVSFSLIRDANLGIPVYVYVRSDQIQEYTSVLGDFCILIQLPNDNYSISEIRFFIQWHQYLLGNNIFMLDDDITGFDRYIEQKYSSLEVVPSSLFEVCQIINEESRKGYDILYLLLTAKTIRFKLAVDADFLPIIAIAFYISKEAYSKGLFFDKSVICEDTNFSIQAYLNDLISCKVVSYCVHSNLTPEYSHFTNEWRIEGVLDTYLRYGTCVRALFCTPGLSYVIISLMGITSYKRNGLTYSRKLDKVLERIISNPNLMGYNMLNRISWKSTGPYYEDLLH